MESVSSDLWTTTLTSYRAVVSGAKRAQATQNLTGVKCTDITPYDTEEALLIERKTFERRWQVFTEPADIIIGDLIQLSGGSRQYLVYEAMPWPLSNPVYVHLRVSEDV